MVNGSFCVRDKHAKNVVSCVKRMTVWPILVQ